MENDIQKEQLRRSTSNSDHDHAEHILPSNSKETTLKSTTITQPVGFDVGGSFLQRWCTFAQRILHNSQPFVQKENYTQVLPLTLLPSTSLSLSPGSLGGELRFIKFPSHHVLEFIEFALATKLISEYGEGQVKIINGTGGGAFKYKDLIYQRLDISVIMHDEMGSMIKGLNFLLENYPSEIFTYSEDKKVTINIITQQNQPTTDNSANNATNIPNNSTPNKKTSEATINTDNTSINTEEVDGKNHSANNTADQSQNTTTNTISDSIYPYVLCSAGSGVSILLVTDSENFRRISGSSIGGATFWGLTRLLTGIDSYAELKRKVSEGDNNNVDLLVGDIYGGDYAEIGLKANVVASSMGKASVNPKSIVKATDFKAEDMAKSLMIMISSNIAQIAYLNAKMHNVKRVFFSGGFVRENPLVWTKLTTYINYWSQGEMKAMFLEHDGYLGALGSLLYGIGQDVKTPEPQPRSSPTKPST